METNFKVYTKKTQLVNGVETELTQLVGTYTRDELVKARDASIQQRDRMQELVDISTRKVELVDEAILNGSDSIIL